MRTLQWPSSRGSGIISLYVKYLQCIRLTQTRTLFELSQSRGAPAAVTGKTGEFPRERGRQTGKLCYNSATEVTGTFRPIASTSITT